jgi:putative transposase
MPNYRRAQVAGGTFFFTVVTHRRRRIFHRAENRTLLGDAIRSCRENWPFEINAIVLLPDHLHAIWTLPKGDGNFSGRWSVIKKTFTAAFLAQGGEDRIVSPGKQREARRGIWQRRFWEHLIADELDFQTHFDYIHFNPVKHRLVTCPNHWEATSFHRWVKAGVYEADWGCASDRQPKFPATTDDYGEPDDGGEATEEES